MCISEGIECLSFLYLENVSDTLNSVKQTGVTSLTSIPAYLKLESKPLKRIDIEKKNHTHTKTKTNKNYLKANKKTPTKPKYSKNVQYCHINI